MIVRTLTVAAAEELTITSLTLAVTQVLSCQRRVRNASGNYIIKREITTNAFSKEIRLKDCME